MPETIPAPAIESAVVPGFQNGVEHVVVLEDMPAPGTVADVDARTRHVVDAVVGDRDSQRHRDLHAGHLFLSRADIVDEVVLGARISGIFGCLWADRAIEVFERDRVLIAERWRTHGLRTTYEADRTATHIVAVVAFDGDPAIVSTDEYGVATQLREFVLGDDHVLGVLEVNGSFAGNHPVAAQQRLGALQER